jgi:hypothetical protein
MKSDGQKSRLGIKFGVASTGIRKDPIAVEPNSQKPHTQPTLTILRHPSD